MSTNSRNRLRKLEEAIARPTRPWVIIDERLGDPAEQERRMRAAGEISAADLVVRLRHF
jgi:hypothetical protein